MVQLVLHFTPLSLDLSLEVLHVLLLLVYVKLHFADLSGLFGYPVFLDLVLILRPIQFGGQLIDLLLEVSFLVVIGPTGVIQCLHFTADVFTLPLTLPEFVLHASERLFGVFEVLSDLQELLLHSDIDLLQVLTSLPGLYELHLGVIIAILHGVDLFLELVDLLALLVHNLGDVLVVIHVLLHVYLGVLQLQFQVFDLLFQ